jgi:hypothetical protein
MGIFRVGGLGSWQSSVGGDQIADGKWRMSEEKLSSLRAENDMGRMFAASRSTHGRNERRLGEKSVDLRVVMTPENMATRCRGDKDFGVKLS